MAADHLDQLRITDLPGDHRRCRLVQQGHPLLDSSLRDEREALEGATNQLTLDEAPDACQLAPLDCERACRDRIVADGKRVASAKVGQHPLLEASRQPLEQPCRPLQPAARLGRAAEVQTVERELQRQACGDPPVTVLSGQPVAALVRVQRRRPVELCPRRHSQAQQRLGRLALHQRSLEPLTRLLPRRTGKRLATRPDQVTRLQRSVRHARSMASTGGAPGTSRA